MPQAPCPRGISTQGSVPFCFDQAFEQFSTGRRNLVLGKPYTGVLPPNLWDGCTMLSTNPTNDRANIQGKGSAVNCVGGTGMTSARSIPQKART